VEEVSTSYNRAHHRFAVFVAGATFLLLVAGALVTSNDAGLSVPDWPTSYGSYYKLPPWTGGIIYEHSHRMLAEFIGTLTIAIAVWTWISDGRPWMKVLAVGALGTIILQGILGGLTVLHFLPPAVSSAHAAVGQTFFCIACAIALFTGRTWIEDKNVAQVAQVEPASYHPRLLTLAFVSIVILYAQLILGAMFRHHGMSWLPHVLTAPFVAIMIAWTAIRALTQYSKIAAIRRPAVAMIFLLMAQLCLGFLAFMTRVEWGKDAAQPEFPMIVSTVAHVATGALLLASTFILTIQVWRHVPAAVKERLPDVSQKPASRKTVTA
jgi:cytochrome c oxidase assembly protein subunit 15